MIIYIWHSPCSIPSARPVVLTSVTRCFSDRFRSKCLAVVLVAFFIATPWSPTVLTLLLRLQSRLSIIQSHPLSFRPRLPAMWPLLLSPNTPLPGPPPTRMDTADPTTILTMTYPFRMNGRENLRTVKSMLPPCHLRLTHTAVRQKTRTTNRAGSRKAPTISYLLSQALSSVETRNGD